MNEPGKSGTGQSYTEREKAAFKDRQLIKPEKYVWKKSYSLVLLANATYILLFYFLMNFLT